MRGLSAITLIGHHDARLFLKERWGVLWLFLVPLFFIFITGAATRPSGGPRTARPSVVIDNRDPGFLGAALVAGLGEQGLRVVAPGGEGAGEVERGIRIPEDFTEKILAGERSDVVFERRGGGGRAESAALVKTRLTRALVALNGRLVESALRAGDDGEGPGPASAAGASAVSIDPAAFAALAGRDPIVRLEARFAGRRKLPAGFEHALPANLTLFLMMNLLIFGGASISWERTSGVFRRLASCPPGRAELVAGKLYGRMILAGVQVVFFLLAGPLFFGVSWGTSPLALGLVLLVYSWLCAALGILIGALVADPDKTAGLCVLAAIVMGALGGCWWPLEVAPDALQTLGRTLPTAWMVDALHRLISFGGGLADILPQLGALAAAAAIATAAAARFLRFQ